MTKINLKLEFDEDLVAETQKIVDRTVQLYTILESVRFPKGTKLKGVGGALEVRSPNTPVYEIRMKD